MAKFSDYMENLIINHLLRAVVYSPVNTYVALFTSNTGLESNAPVNEASGGSYARQFAELGAASGGASTSVANISFPTATGAWGTLSNLALVDHVSNLGWGINCNTLMWSNLDVPKTVNTGDTFKINTGDLAVNVA